MNAIQQPAWKLGRWRLALVIAVVLSSSLWPRAVAQQGSVPRPLWEIDLSKFGYAGRPREPGEVGHSWWSRQNLVFTREGVLATTFEVHIEPSELSIRGNTRPTDPYHMVALFLDAGRGDVIQKGDWPVDAAKRTWFVPGQDGQFILGMGDKLSLYAPDLSIVAERTLPVSFGQFLMVMASPAADTFLVFYAGQSEVKYVRKLDLLDTAHLSTLRSWSGDEAEPTVALWGNQLARFSDHDLRVETLDSGPTEVPAAIDMYCGYRSFINQNTLAVGKFGKSGCNAVALVSTNGRIVRELHLDPKGLTSAALASKNGRVFAIPGYASQRLPWRPYVKVFGLESEKPLLSVDIPPAPDGSDLALATGFSGKMGAGDSRFDWSSAALSPRGDLLAIRAGSLLRVYRIPEMP